MELKGLTYKQFSMIREALLEKGEKIWQEKYGSRAKNLDIKELQVAKERFDKITNPWCPEGICNSVLRILEEKENELQAELSNKNLKKAKK